MRYRKIPSETIRRLPVYIRALSLIREQGNRYISSPQLAEQLGIKPPQIRKDLSYFGAFGTRGVGYEIDQLIRQIKAILKLMNNQEIALVGAGRLGKAISLYSGFKAFGLDVAAIFDIDPKKIGTRIGKITVENIAKTGHLKKRNIKLAILAVPADAAQKTADILVHNGIKGILNLAPCYLAVPPQVKVITIDIATKLGVLPYYI